MLMQATVRLSSSSSKLNLVGRCKSYATSVKNQTVKLQKVPRRIPKEKRRVTVASFVEQYRASNEGRFPSATLVRKELGGCYYVNREIVQELEYNYKLARAAQSNPVPPVHLRESSTGTSSKFIKVKVVPAVPVAKKGVEKEEVSGTSADVSLDEQGRFVGSTKVEVPIDSTINATTSMDKEQPSLNVQEVKKASEVETRTQTLQGTPVEAEKFKMSYEVSKPETVPEKQDSNEHNQYATTEGGGIWGNFKSFSDKIINFWKKF